MNRSIRVPMWVRPLLLGMLVAAGVTACGADDADPGEPGRQVEPRAGQGREETRGIRNTESIGYAGNAIGAKVDQAIEINENRADDLDRRLEEQTR